jgi:hypothetical protein
MGLCPEDGVSLDGGGIYLPSMLQRKVWAYWQEFWRDWVPEVTKGEPYIVVMNGDAVEGDHHHAKTPISTNVADQQAVAMACLEPVARRAAAYYHIRGTEAHVGPSGENEETLARALGAIPDRDGNHARWELWLDLRGHLIHFSHHIGTSGSSAYESTAVFKELHEAFVEAGRWGKVPPQVVIRSHRHRSLEVRIPTGSGHGISAVTAAWQLKTPITHRIAAARAGQPQIGGMVIRAGERILYTDSRVWDIDRPRAEVFK